MVARRYGFTMVELVIAILIGSILTSIALASFRNVTGRFAARGAKQTFAAMHARTRATAVESGQTVRLVMNSGADSAFIVRNDTILDVMRFDEEFNVDVRSTPSRFILCMGPQGYGDTDCSTTSSPITLQFWLNADSTTLIILPMGQLVGL